MYNRRCPSCRVFVPVEQLPANIGDNYSYLKVIANVAEYSDRLALRCMNCFSEVAHANIEFKFDIKHYHDGDDWSLNGLPVYRENIFRMADGKRRYGVKVNCSFLCTCNWTGLIRIEVDAEASKFNSNNS